MRYDHVSFGDNAYEFIDVIMPFLESLKASTHSMSNILIRVDRDTARAETYWHVFHREAGQDATTTSPTAVTWTGSSGGVASGASSPAS